jgi:hypothetical protein
MEDICNTSKGFGFLFGEANLDLSVGLFSFARYSDDISAASPRFLRRCGMVLCHEVGHLFGIKHCVYASCIMNGSNHLDESESRPFAVCPVDLRKLQLTLDQAKVQGRDTQPVDLVARERSLALFFYEHGLPYDARFSRTLVSALTGKAEPEPAAAGVAEAAGDELEPPLPLRQPSDGANKSPVSRQPSGMCVEPEEHAVAAVVDASMTASPPEVARLPSHDKRLLVKAYA